MSRDHLTETEALTEAVRHLADVLSELNDEVHQVHGRIDHTRMRLGALEQAHEWMRQRISNVEHDSAIKDVSTDRALAALVGHADAILIELEPNGQPKATAFRGPFKIESEGAYDGAWVREARGEVGERLGGALAALAAYIRSERLDQFAGYSNFVDGDRPTYSGPPNADDKLDKSA